MSWSCVVTLQVFEKAKLAQSYCVEGHIPLAKKCLASNRYLHFSKPGLSLVPINK